MTHMRLRYADRVFRGPLLLVLLVAGCDGLFKLGEVPAPDGDRCDYATLPDDGDEDMDTIINGLDRCPTVASEGDHDEDGDGTVDACDPCPMVEIAGTDDDCDLVGVACDVDDSTPHVQTFFGFGDAKGLSTSDVVIANDRLGLPSGSTVGSVRTTAAVSPIGRYETAGRVTQIDDAYRSIAITLTDTTTGFRYEGQLALDNAYAELVIQRDNVNLTSLSLSKPQSPEVAFQLFLEYDGVTLTARIVGDYEGSTSFVASLGPVTYGVTGNHDTSMPVNEVDYLRRIAPQ